MQSPEQPPCFGTGQWGYASPKCIPCGYRAMCAVATVHSIRALHGPVDQWASKATAIAKAIGTDPNSVTALANMAGLMAPDAQPAKQKSPPAKRAPTLKATAPTTEKLPPKLTDAELRTLWEAERRQSEHIRALQPGTIVRHTFIDKRPPVVATYQEGCVIWNGQKWPSLASIRDAASPPVLRNVRGIERLHPNFSVAKFFTLGRKSVAQATKQLRNALKGW